MGAEKSDRLTQNASFGKIISRIPKLRRIPNRLCRQL